MASGRFAPATRSLGPAAPRHHRDRAGGGGARCRRRHRPVADPIRHRPRPGCPVGPVARHAGGGPRPHHRRGRRRGCLDADGIADHSPFLAIVGSLPVVRDQVEGLRDLTEVTDRLGDAARTPPRRSTWTCSERGASPQRGSICSTPCSARLDDIEGTVADLDVGAEGDLLGPLANARQRVVAELDRVPERLDEARGYVGGLRRLLAGPSRYLLLGANNAEMRGGAGMPLSAGVVTIENGDIDFGDFTQLAYQNLGEPACRLPSALAGHLSALALRAQLPRDGGVAELPVTGPMYRAHGPERRVRRGGRRARGRRRRAAPSPRGHRTCRAGRCHLRRRERRAEGPQRELPRVRHHRRPRRPGRAAVGAGQADLRGVQGARGTRRHTRHCPPGGGQRSPPHRPLGDPAVQTLWESIGADGSLNPFGLMVTAQNVAANKLDWYIDPKVTLNVLEAPTGPGRPGSPSPSTTPRSSARARRSTAPTTASRTAPTARWSPSTCPRPPTTSPPRPDVQREGADPPLHMAANRFEIPRGDDRAGVLRVLAARGLAAAHSSCPRAACGRWSTRSTATAHRRRPPRCSGRTPSPTRRPPAPPVAAVLVLAGALAVLVGVRPACS